MPASLRVASAFPDPPFDDFTITPGDVLLAEDTTGSGHEWRIVGPDPWCRAYVSLDGVSLESIPPKDLT